MKSTTPLPFPFNYATLLSLIDGVAYNVQLPEPRRSAVTASLNF